MTFLNPDHCIIAAARVLFKALGFALEKGPPTIVIVYYTLCTKAPHVAAIESFLKLYLVSFIKSALTADTIKPHSDPIKKPRFQGNSFIQAELNYWR